MYLLQISTDLTLIFLRLSYSRLGSQSIDEIQRCPGGQSYDEYVVSVDVLESAAAIAKVGGWSHRLRGGNVSGCPKVDNKGTVLTEAWSGGYWGPCVPAWAKLRKGMYEGTELWIGSGSWGDLVGKSGFHGPGYGGYPWCFLPDCSSWFFCAEIGAGIGTRA